MFTSVLDRFSDDLKQRINKFCDEITFNVGYNSDIDLVYKNCVFLKIRV